MNDRPWMTALEMQFVARTLAKKSVSAASLKRRGSPLFHAEHDAANLLPNSETFAWCEDTTKAVWTASKTVPDDAVIDVSALLHSQRSQWWWFDWPLPIPMDKPAGDDLDTQHICALLIEYTPSGAMLTDGKPIPGLAISEFRRTPYGPMIVSFAIMPDGRTLKEVLEGGRLDIQNPKGGVLAHSQRALSTLRFVLAATVWLNQKIVVAASGAVERHRRKQLAREHDAEISDVKVISLRRAEQQQHNTDGGGELVEWSCRWVVNGHWRNQFHPSTGKHELKYILPYVKGPEDKPLKVPTHTVYTVTR